MTPVGKCHHIYSIEFASIITVLYLNGSQKSTLKTKLQTKDPDS